MGLCTPGYQKPQILKGKIPNLLFNKTHGSASTHIPTASAEGLDK